MISCNVAEALRRNMTEALEAQDVPGVASVQVGTTIRSDKKLLVAFVQIDSSMLADVVMEALSNEYGIFTDNRQWPRLSTFWFPPDMQCGFDDYDLFEVWILEAV